MIKPLDTLIAHKVIGLSGELTSTDKRVAAMLIEHFNRKTGQCDPSLDTMADLIGVDRRTIVRSINRLVKSGLFRKVRHGGKFHRNSYEPMWTVFHRLDDIWGDRRRARRAKFVSPNLSLCEGRTCRPADDQNVTQTFTKNHFKKTLSASAQKSEQLTKPHKDDPLHCEGPEAAGGLGIFKVRIEKRLGEENAYAWFRKAHFVDVIGGVVTLSVDTAYIKSRIENWFGPEILGCFEPEHQNLVRVDAIVRKPKP